ncbi:MAG: PadR family transcriptional regulator [Candidatus Thermoplasmatota archaeon]
MKEELSTNINTILSTMGLRHTLHLYTPDVNKYAIQAPFLASTAKDEKAIYITADEPSLVAQEFKGLNIDISIIDSSKLPKINPTKKLRIVLDAGSINKEEHIEVERAVAKITKNNFSLCTYDVSKFNPEFIKDLVKSHDKLMLTTSDLTMLSSESYDKLNISDKAIERFVKNDLETVVLALMLNKPMCGTDIIKTLYKEFNILVSPGTIYPLLHSLEKKGLLKCEYKVRTKLYEPPEGVKTKIRSLLNEHVQTSNFLSKFLQSIEQSGKQTNEMEIVSK